jgi:ATP-dependent DNA helicase RecQ
VASAAEQNLEAHLPPFGLTEFRPGQRDVIETVLSGRDCLCVMPTGGGKSLCYQLPAIARDGVTLVISPLIALMKDQVDTLQARGLSATFINSTLTPDEQSARLDQMARGEFKLVYVVPERFRSSRFVEAARQSNVRLLAVDEAHCVSEWGHDFRPDYARLGRFRAQLNNPPTIALTATATDAVRRDIVELLNLHEPAVFITGFARPNLHYSVRVCPTDRDKDQTLFSFLAENPGSGIIYASTRKRCEDLAARISEQTQRSTTVYHAGLQPQERRAAQESFMQGESEIAVATLAFGMGIDKSDVRFVVHYNLPGSIEAYYQEAGRAGRDGKPASCLLLFGGGDRSIHEFFIESSYPSRDVVRQVYQFLCKLEQSPIEMTQQEVKEALGLQIGNEGIGACEKLLESAGAIERLEPNENSAAVRLSSDVPTLVELLPPQAKAKRRVMRAIEAAVGARRHEWCYVQPRELLRELTELDSTDLSRHLRELTALAAFDYVPPFRGRAIHIHNRELPFSQIEIDFETLDAQKAAEYERLEHVLRFARDHRCRQQRILEYFGQKDATACGHCDNCEPKAASGGWGTPRAISGPVLDAVRIVLSGVARVSQRRVGCGKQLLAKMLCGSNDKAVQRNRLDKLSTFGLLGNLKQPEVAQLTDAILLAGLLEQNEIEPFRPIIQLTARGLDVMSGRNEAELALSLPDELWFKLDPQAARATLAQAKQAGVASQAAPDPGLVSLLKSWREAKRQSLNVPAYVILTNAVIDELARARPTTLADLARVKGIGAKKAEQFGGEILAVLGPRTKPAATPPATTAAPPAPTAPTRTTQGEPSPPAAATPTPSPTPAKPPSAAPRSDSINQLFLEEAADAFESAGYSDSPAASSTSSAPASQPPSPLASTQPSHYWTWRLLSQGFSPVECAAIRSLSEEVVLDHALRAADSGLTIDARWFLPAERIASIRAIIGPNPPSRIRPLLDKLPRGTRYEDVQLVIKSRACGDAPGVA